MTPVRADWSWKPPGKIAEALKRGNAKVREFNTRGQRLLIDLTPRDRVKKRRPPTKKELRELEQLRKFVAWREAAERPRDEDKMLDAWHEYRAKREELKGNALPRDDADADKNPSRRRVDHDCGDDGDAPTHRGSDVRRGRASSKRRRSRGATMEPADVAMDINSSPQQRRAGGGGVRSRKPVRAPAIAGSGCDEGAAAMSWATVVLLNMTATKAVYRCADSSTAIKWAEDRELRDYIVVKPGYRASAFSNGELTGLLKQFGDPRVGMKKEEQERVVMDYLSRYDESRHDKDGMASTGAYYTVPQNHQPINGGDDTVSKENVVAKKKKGAEKTASAKAKGKAAGKTLTPKPAKQRETKGDGLGREGTATRLICMEIVKGKLSDDKILENARKAFPENKIGNGYVGWYRNKLIKDGVLNKEGKPVKKAG